MIILNYIVDFLFTISFPISSRNIENEKFRNLYVQFIDVSTFIIDIMLQLF